MTDPALATAASLQQKLEAERQRVAELEALLRRLIDPEDLGHNVRGQEVWKLIRQELGQTKSAEERGLVRDALKR